MTPTREALIGRWFASPEIDELLQKIEFREDGTGLVLSGGGQAIFLEANFQWELGELGRLILRFKETKGTLCQPYVPTAVSMQHEVSCVLEEGAFALYVAGAMGTITYKRRLRFDESPLPRDAASYHSRSLFFSVVNQLDPRGFLVFYSGVGISEVVPRPRPSISWRETLMRSEEFRLARFPNPSREASGATSWVRVVAGREHLLEASIEFRDRSVNLIRWFLPGTSTEIGRLQSGNTNGWGLSVEERPVGELRQEGDRVVLLGNDREEFCREKSSGIWSSQFERRHGFIASRSAPIATLERHISSLELTEPCAESERLLLIAACLLANERDLR